jgi:CheY-like chemotaxis protein
MNMKAKQAVTILLIEDDDVDALAVERSFTKRRIGNSIVRAKDGLEGLEALKSGQVKTPFIILLDLQMPRMNGLEFLSAVRKDPNLSSAVIFVLTTSRAESDILASYENHIAGYFVKEDVGANFSEMIDVLEGYWQIAYLPQK